MEGFYRILYDYYARIVGCSHAEADALARHIVENLKRRQCVDAAREAGTP